MFFPHIYVKLKLSSKGDCVIPTHLVFKHWVINNGFRDVNSEM